MNHLGGSEQTDLGVPRMCGIECQDEGCGFSSVDDEREEKGRGRVVNKEETLDASDVLERLICR